MRKTRRKAVSILVALTFLLGLVLAYAGPAGAQTDRCKFSGAFDYVEVDKDQPAGYAQVVEYASDSWSGTLYVTVRLPSGVTYAKEPADDTNFSKYAEKAGTGNISFYTATESSLTVTVATSVYTDGVKFKFDEKGYSALNIAADVSGDIKATIEVMQVGADKKIHWVETGTVTIARVAAKAVTVTAGDPVLIQPGTAKDGATITIREGVAGSLAENEWVYGKIETAGVTFNANFVAADVVGSGVSVDGFSQPSDTEFKFQITSASSGLPGKVTIDLTDALDVSPTVTGDIKITIYGAGTTKIPKTTVTVAKVGAAAVNITDIKNTGATLYASDKNPQDVKVAAGPTEFKLKSTGTALPAGVVTLELNAGEFPATNPFTAGTYPVKVYNKGTVGYKAAWFEITGTPPAELTIKDFKVIVPGDTPPGDLVVKVGGTIGVSGEVTLGKIVKPFTVSASSVPEIPYPSQAQAAGDLVIKEAAAGVVKDGKLVIKLPANITFAGTPTVKVTDGDLRLETVATNVYGELEIPISNPSVLASTITISGIKYNVSRLALEGDVEVQIYGSGGSWDGKTIAKVVNAKVVTVSPTKREASFVIGSTTYTVNGKEYAMDVAPYIKNDRTYLPVRYVAYALGVSEDNIFYGNGVVSILKGGRAVQVTIGSKALVVNGVTIQMDVAPELSEGRTMLPFRWIATALGASVSWDEETKTVTMVVE